MGYDTSLPFFAYGMFMHGELGWLLVRDFVATVNHSATIHGELLERDGLLVLDPEAPRRAPGMILQFHSNAAKAAYLAIDELEPRHQYSWRVVEAVLGENSTKVNALIGRSPRKGSKPLEEPWSGRRDPLFTEGLSTVEALIVESEKESAALPAFFRAQAAYLLLWTAVERYATFRYGLGGESIARNLRLVAREPAFQRALRTHVERTDKVQRSDRPRDHESLSPTDPVGSMLYYYQLRSNVAHRGKAAVRDDKRLRSSSRELLQVFRDVLQRAFDEASEPIP